MLATELPTRPEDLTVSSLNEVIKAHTPNVSLDSFEVVESHLWGEGQASSAGRIIIEPTYSSASPENLPRRIVVKVAKSAPGDKVETGGSGSGQLYENEVNVYAQLRPADFMISPVTLGGRFDPQTKTFMLLLEDLRDREAVFPSVKTDINIAQMQSMLDQYASLHARYWNHPEFGRSMGWLEDHTRGAIHDLFTSDTVAGFAEYQVATTQFKQEMLQRLRMTPKELHGQFQRAQAHQSTLPQTLCHGDAHIGNTYLLPNDQVGLLDWQLSARGYCMHDISYIITTGLSIEQRRTHERDLVTYYREQLCARGVTDVPSMNDMWSEYRRAMAWNLYIGWLITPVVNYGWDITVMAVLRTITAYEDHETHKALADI
ncbi:phosphotransferase [Pseudomaricurvus sp.]|uniref:phosphotransferase n=1 Tax=Pseudomaricurvus sp. TaxID=2004510 RepID=UPI003F6D52E5